MPTKAAGCCSTLRRPTAGRRCWRSERRCSAGSTGGRRPTAGRAQLDHRRAGGPSTAQVAGRPASGRRGSPTPGSPCCARPGEQAPEIWCRCDGGPHGFLSIAAHAHADALSVEVRYGGRGRPRRPGHLLLSRRARLAFVLPLDHRAQHRRARRPEPVQRGRPLPLAAACARPGRSKSPTTATWRGGPQSTTATPRLTRRRGTAARSGWTGRRAVIDIVDEIEGGSHDVRAGLPSAVLTFRRNSTRPARSCAGPAHPSPARRGLNCRASCGGACTEGRLTRSSAGTRMAWDGGRRRSP